MTFNQLIDSIVANLARKTNNKATNAGFNFASQTLKMFRDEFGNQLYTKSEILRAINEVAMENKTGKYVYVDDLLYELEQGE